MSNQKTSQPAFVTYGWCRTAYTVVRSLGRQGIEVHVGDSSPLAMSRFSKYCKKFHRLPDFFANPDEYFQAVITAMNECGAKVLFPCHEDVECFAKRKNELPRDIKIAVPDPDMWGIAEDKLLYSSHVMEAGCPVPQTYQIKSTQELEAALGQLDFPVAVKTRIGNSAKGVRISNDKESCKRDFFELIDQFDLAPSRWPTLQEFVDGPKLGTLGIYNRGKHVSSIVFEIRRSKGADNFGTSTYRVTIDDPVTKENAIKAMESLNWHGVVDMDWIRGSDGVAKLIDINGRLGGATALTCFSGMDMPLIWYQIATETISGTQPTPNFGAQARWILGDTLGFLDCLLSLKLRDCYSTAKPIIGCKNDDLILSDPLPFLGQLADYGTKFLRSGGSTNPTTKGMVH